MAYMNQEKKSKIAAALKQVVPAGWKYSLAVRHHSSIVMTISAAPVDLIGAHKKSEYFDPATETYTTVNNYHFRSHLADQSVADTFEKIFAALNIDNFDESDIMTDYFHVGHYVDLNIGSWNKPFMVTEQIKKAA
jgi:hypothetical protein